MSPPLPPTGIASPLLARDQRRHGDGGQNPDNRDGDQELDQGEALFVYCTRASHVPTCNKAPPGSGGALIVQVLILSSNA